MALLKEDGSLDVERINQLPLEEHIKEIESLTNEQYEEYLSKLPINESQVPMHAIPADYPMEEYGVDAKEFLKEMEEKYGIKKVAKKPPTSKLNVYHCQSEAQGRTIEEKCINCAKEAIAALFPDVQVESACIRRSYYCKEDLLKSAEDFPLLTNFKIKEKEYNEFLDWLEKTLREKYFKEYYELSVEVYTDATKTKIKTWTVEVEINLKEAVVIRSGLEFKRFFESLEPDYEYVWEGLNEHLGYAVDLS